MQSSSGEGSGYKNSDIASQYQHSTTLKPTHLVGQQRVKAVLWMVVSNANMEQPLLITFRLHIQNNLDSTGILIG